MDKVGTHVCKESSSCDCYLLALEPSEDCPTHGNPFPRRCGECGRFMTDKVRAAQLELVALLLDDESGPNEALIALAEEYKADVLAGLITSSK